jgi:hypothetical protein
MLVTPVHTQRRIGKALLVLACGAALLMGAGSAAAQSKGLLDNATKESLMVVAGNLNTAIERYDAFTFKQSSAVSQLAALEARLVALNKELQEAQNRRRRLEDLDIQDPGAVNPASLQRMRAQTDQLVNDRRELVEKINETKANSSDSVAEREDLRLQVVRAQREYDTLVNFFIDKVVERRRGDLEKTTRVRVSAEVGCDDLTVSGCRTKAMKEAERKAAERGSVVFMESVTEINNMNISRDQIKSTTNAKLERVEVHQQGFINDTTYKVELSADVTTRVVDEVLADLRQSIKRTVEVEVGGLRQMRAVNNIANRPAAPSRTESELDALSEQANSRSQERQRPAPKPAARPAREPEVIPAPAPAPATAPRRVFIPSF